MKPIGKRLIQQIRGFGFWFWQQANETPLGLLVVILTSVFLSGILRETMEAKNLGFEDKSLWDWMDLLIVSLIVAISAFLLNQSARRSEQDIAQNNREADLARSLDMQRQESLEKFLDRMSELLLEQELNQDERLHKDRTQSDDSVKHQVSIVVKSIATARTVATLKGLDGERKGQLVRFLFGSGMISGIETWVELDEVDLEGAVFRDADLRNVNFQNAYLAKVDFSGANLSGASFRQTVLFGANFNHATLTGANLGLSVFDEKSTLIETQLIGVDLNKAFFSGTNLQGANLNEAHAEINFVSFRSSNLEKAVMTNAILIQADLSNAILMNANMEEINLTKAYLIGANLQGAILRGGNLTQAYLQNALLSDADLRGADMSEANLDGAVINNVISDSSTIWPSGFQIKAENGRISPIA